MKKLVLFSLAVFATLPLSAQQVTNLNDSGPGSLRGAILSANAGDVISFDQSLLANGSDTLYLQSDLIINKGLTIQGLYSGADTLFISGEKNTRIFYVDIVGGSDRHLRLHDLALVNGRDTVSTGDGHGGAMLVLNADSLTIENCLFKENENNNGGNGGACNITGVDVTIKGSAFLSNKVINNQDYSYGGAIYLHLGSLDIDQSYFIRNKSIYSTAGILIWDAPLRCRNTLFDDNDNIPGFTNSAPGGAIYSFNHKVYLEHCIFLNNQASARGSAVQLRSNTTDLYGVDSILDCYFANNYLRNGQLAGGAVDARSIYIGGCTFESNKTSVNQGGGTALSAFDCEIVNSTFSGHTSTKRGIIAVGGYTIMENVTVTNNLVTSHRDNGVITSYLINPPSVDTIEIKGCIIAGNAPNAIYEDGIHGLHVISRGYNVLYGTPTSAQSTDITGVTTGLNMEPLAMNGGLYPTHVPMPSSPAYNAGDSTDFSNAQNGPIYGRRDIGAAERRILIYDTTLVCGNLTWWGSNYSSSGIYTDTAFNANSIDSVGVLVLYSQDTAIANINSVLVAREQSPGTSYQWVNCDSSFAPVIGATDSTFQPSVNGNYAVVLTNGNCSDTSACILYDEVSLQESTAEDILIEFFPNPTSGGITIKASKHLPSQVTVLDLSGREVASMAISSNEVELPSLSKGLYLLRWEFENGEVQVDRVLISF